MPTLDTTFETELPADPNFPGGYSYQENVAGGGSCQTFDFTSNLYYAAVADSPGTTGGIAVTDLSTMHVTRTVTMAQMYAGTPYGPTPGVPWDATIWELLSGNGTDLYLSTSGPAPGYVYKRFTRVNPVTMKVTGEFYLSPGTPPPITSVVGGPGAVNKTTSHTIVIYKTHGALHVGPMIFDGTGMAPIGMGAMPAYGAFEISVMPAARRANGSCDFAMINYDRAAGSNNVELWRINVTDSLTITSTHTGTFNTAPYFTAGTTLWMGQANYDAAHDCLILWLQPAINGPPTYLFSVNWDGSIRWVQGPLANIRTVAGNRGQSQLTGNTLMIGNGLNLTMINTSTGAITFTGAVADVSTPFFFQVWDAGRSAYWTFSFGGLGFVRIDFIGERKLAMDDLVVTATPTLLNTNLVSLRWSDDRAHTWGSPVTQSIGEVGEYRTSLQWQRLGMARDRCFEVSWSVNMPTALQGCWFDATPAQS